MHTFTCTHYIPHPSTHTTSPHTTPLHTSHLHTHHISTHHTSHLHTPHLHTHHISTPHLYTPHTSTHHISTPHLYLHTPHLHTHHTSHLLTPPHTSTHTTSPHTSHLHTHHISNTPTPPHSTSASTSGVSEGGTSGLGTQLDVSDVDPNSSLGTRSLSRIRSTIPGGLGTRTQSHTPSHDLGTSQYDYMGSMYSLGTLHPGEEDFHGSLTSVNIDDLGTQRDDLTGSLTSLESFLDTRPRVSPINSIMEENEGDDGPHLSIQASELGRREWVE